MRRIVLSVLLLTLIASIPILCISDAHPALDQSSLGMVPAPEASPEAEASVSLDGMLALPEGAGSSLSEVTPRTAVSASAEQALAITPEWLRMDLYDMFTRLRSTLQDDYGQLLLSITDPRLIDEVAFTIAHSSASVLGQTDPDLYVRNAELLYQVDPEIPYADIVDYGQAGTDPDYYSTIRYRTVRGGVMGEFELPRDIYYWFVVHPKLGKETPSMSPEMVENACTYGYFWREYLFYNPCDEYDYSLNYMVRQPYLINQSDLDGWGPAASGYLTDGTRTCPDGVVVGGPDIERPVLVEYVWDEARIIVTTMEVERAANQGKTQMLENMVMRSNGQWGDTLISREAEGDYYDKVVIIDGTGDLTITNPIRDALSRNGIDSWVYDEDRMLTSAEWLDFSKVIIASHQSRAFYETVAGEQFMSNLNNWADFRGTIEFHAACDPDDSWSDLGLFKLGYVPEQIDSVTINNFPVLGEVIGNAAYLWDDSVVNASLPGFRPFEPESMAVDVIGNWTSRMINFRARASRPSQPNQICFEHDGNCGEIRYLLHAAARTCLLPSAGVCNNSWDHVTCEFWEQDWQGYQVNFNVGASMIADGKVLNDKDYGGTRDLSAIEQDRGDSFPVNATARYTKSCRLHATVLDAAENPVDCAEVRPWVHWMNKPSERLDSPISAYTDSAGEVILDLGDHRDYYFDVKSRAGDASRELLLTDTLEGMDYYHTWTITEGVVPQLPPIEPLEFPPPEQCPFKLHISFEAEYETIYRLGGSTFAEKKADSANVDFFMLGQADFDKYEARETFFAYERRQDTRVDEFDAGIPDAGPYYLVFSNEDTLMAKQFVRMELELFRNDGGTWTPVEGFSNFVGIPAQKSYVVMFGGGIGDGPSVYAAGFFDAEVDPQQSFQLSIQALVSDPDGTSDVSSVELCYGGIGLGKYLTDDGSGADAAAGDGIFTFAEEFLPGSLSSGLYKLEVVAEDTAGNRSASWPYLNILASPLTLLPNASCVGLHTPAGDASGDGAPVILGGGFFGNETAQAGDTVRMMVYVYDPDGPSDIDRVELFLEGGLATGVFLNDDGINGDDHAGDGMYTFQTWAPAGLPAGNMTLEVVAFDKSGNSSATYPYFTVR